MTLKNSTYYIMHIMQMMTRNVLRFDVERVNMLNTERLVEAQRYVIFNVTTLINYYPLFKTTINYHNILHTNISK
jgi:hypothetical protein